MNISIYFISFIIFAFIGWLVEVMSVYFWDKKLVNRGFLLGPYCPIYGFGGIFMVLLLERYLKDPITLFFMAIIICSILEYFTSFIMEKLFKARWWDYSRRKYNINGRICLETLVPFGLLGVLVMYVLNPLVLKLISFIPSLYVEIVAGVIFSLFLSDVIISLIALANIKIGNSYAEMDSTEEITKQVREFIAAFSKRGNRLINSFPTMKVYINKKKGRK